MIDQLEDINIKDVYDLMSRLDRILEDANFNHLPFSKRVGARRMRTYLNHFASGLRMYKGGRFEEHSITSIHFQNFKKSITHTL